MTPVTTAKIRVGLDRPSVPSLGLANNSGVNAQRNRRSPGRRTSRPGWIAVMACVMSMAGAGLATSAPLQSDHPPWGMSGPDIDAGIVAAITEASRRFNLPMRWIAAVVGAESAFNARAISRVGAMGLMQLMPQTWADLRDQYGLGADPFDVHDNIIAGAGYLRQMRDRFGLLGMLAAYNAGPDRYAEYLAGISTLPAATQAYVVQITDQMGLAGQPEIITHSHPIAADWRHASLFSGPASTQSAAIGALPTGPTHNTSKTNPVPFDLPPTDLFAPTGQPDPQP